MAGGESDGAPARTITYCVVPFGLAAKLHDALRQHFMRDPGVEVIVERRGRERRRPDDQRETESTPAKERRRIRNAMGRRIGPRRAPAVVLDSPSLPRKARPYADQLVFFERIEPSEERLADFDSARLVTRFQAGDSEAFATLYLRYFDRVYAYLRVIFRETPDEAEDATQQVFMQVLETLARYEHRGQPFRAWLFTIARNWAVSRLRALGRDQLVEPRLLDLRREKEPATVPVVEIAWLTDRELVMFVERLPVAQRQVLLLRYMLDLPTSEISRILGRGADDVRMLEHRALRFLEKRLTAVSSPALPRHRPLGDRARVMWMPVLRRRKWALNPNPGRVGLR